MCLLPCNHLKVEFRNRANNPILCLYWSQFESKLKEDVWIDLHMADYKTPGK